MDESKKAELTVLRNEPQPCQIKLDVEVPVSRVQAVRKQVAGLFHNQATVPGFRPVKSPQKLLERKYAKQIRQETVDRLLNQTGEEAIKQAELTPETRPRVENEESLTVEEGQPFVYSLTFDVAPEFELPDYRSFVISPETAAVDNDAVEAFIDRMLEQRTSYQTVERAAEPGDMLTVSYRGKLQDTDEEELPETARFLLESDSNPLHLREPEMLPGATEQLAGHAAGENVDIQVHFPESFVEESLAGKTVDYTVSIKEIQTEVRPELDDETAQSLFGLSTADEARNTVRNYLENAEKQQREQSINNELAAKVVEGMDFSLPPGLLARESYEVFEMQLRRAYRERPTEVQQEDVQKELWDESSRMAADNLRRQYVLRKIAEQEGVELDAGDLDMALEQAAQHHKMSVKQLTRTLRDNGRFVDLVMDVRQRKTMEHLRKLVTVNEPANENDVNASESGEDADDARSGGEE